MKTLVHMLYHVVACRTSSPKSLARFKEPNSLARDAGLWFVINDAENRGLAQLASASGASLGSHRAWAASPGGMAMNAVCACGSMHGMARQCHLLLLHIVFSRFGANHVRLPIQFTCRQRQRKMNWCRCTCA